MLESSETPQGTPEIPADFSTRIPGHLQATWMRKGGCLQQSDYVKNGRLFIPGVHSLTDKEYEEYKKYRKPSSRAESQREYELDLKDKAAFFASEAGKAHQEALWDRRMKHPERLQALKPFLGYVRYALPGQPEFIAWLESKEGSAWVLPFIVDREPVITNRFIFSVVQQQNENMAMLKGVREGFLKFEEEAYIAVANGRLDIAAGRGGRPKDLLRSFGKDASVSIIDTKGPDAARSQGEHADPGLKKDVATLALDIEQAGQNKQYIAAADIMVYLYNRKQPKKEAK